MKLKALLAGAVIALASTAAQAADNFLIQFTDTASTEAVRENVFKNGALIQTASFAHETVIQPFTLFNGATVITSFDNQFNFTEPGRPQILSDTGEVSGTQGNRFININFLSDNSDRLVFLPNGGNITETAGFQNIVIPGIVSNGDFYTIQMASDIGGVPEPSTWALMLLGVGGLGAAMRTTRRKSGAALAAA